MLFLEPFSSNNPTARQLLLQSNLESSRPETYRSRTTHTCNSNLSKFFQTVQELCSNSYEITSTESPSSSSRSFSPPQHSKTHPSTPSTFSSAHQNKNPIQNHKRSHAIQKKKRQAHFACKSKLHLFFSYRTVFHTFLNTPLRCISFQRINRYSIG